MKILVIVLLAALVLSGCSFTIEDTPELRAAFGESPSVSVEPVVVPCLDILGNINRSGEKIYHMVGQSNYNNVHPEAYFCTEEEAQAAGYRKSLR